ncbi:GDSL-like Lipase/Acylhydrolase [Pseudobythopirellula maris]|uniref:GDSL-like Lipase/Acylhydrolase n=1 Tax=Pseudobythopirellula maris TaxID=2527991 RepID=A0A5C5ZFS6_9BACT|nr:SGNH/GDSL hydrolase family protein [Pseudobythopirellula maris]TWT86269.1 GDSL-like Lipase/Acylhydrolase [Pseudobythopirellula maris]
MPSIDRRDLIRSGLQLGAAAAATGLIAPRAASAAEATSSGGLIADGATVLFQGDSITDAGRKRDHKEPNQHATLGDGYALIAATQTLVARPEAAIEFHNRGVSGNKVHQLADRWQEDCLDLKPDVVSILIGVNDIWHWLNGHYDGTVETYRDDYRKLLDRTREELPGMKLVICEPFVLKTGAVTDKWFPTFDGFRETAREIADDYADVWVPFQSVFDKAAEVAEAKQWLRDGVHPSPYGAALMADAWLRAVNG